jgi:hypothetical protein
MDHQVQYSPFPGSKNISRDNIGIYHVKCKFELKTFQIRGLTYHEVTPFLALPCKAKSLSSESLYSILASRDFAP